jgi:hypothetical protein
MTVPVPVSAAKAATETSKQRDNQNDDENDTERRTRVILARLSIARLPELPRGSAKEIGKSSAIQGISIRRSEQFCSDANQSVGLCYPSPRRCRQTRMSARALQRPERIDIESDAARFA